MKKNKFKSDLVLLFELASGWYIDDYLHDRASKSWTWGRIAAEMNEMISRVNMAKVKKAGLFEVTASNLSRWYDRFGIVSMVKRGIPAGFKYKSEVKKNG